MKLRKWMEYNCVTMKYLSERLNIHRTYLYYLMKGTKTVGPKTLSLLREITEGLVNDKMDLVDE